jgi:phasin family protein
MARQSERESSESGHEAAKTAAEQVAQTSRTMADAGERVGRAGADIGQRNAESITSTWRSSSETANRIAERSMDQLSKMFGMTGDTARQALQQSSGNVQAVIESTTIIADGFRDVSEEWMRFTRGSIEQNQERFNELLACRNMQECVALQTQIVRDNLEAFLQGARRTSEVATKVADEAVRKMSQSTLVSA